MLCSHCLMEAIHTHGQGDTAMMLVPAAVVVYHGESLCRGCFVDELHAESPQSVAS